MNLLHIHIPYLTGILFLGGIIFILLDSNGRHTVNNNISHNYYDSTQKGIDVRYIPGPIQTIETTIPAQVDTAAILKEFYAKHIYKQTLGDSALSVDLTWIIFKNSLDSLGFKYKILRPTQIIQPISNKLKVFAGIQGGAGKQGIASIGPEVFVVTPKDHAYKVNFNAVDKSVNVGAFWKIHAGR